MADLKDVLGPLRLGRHVMVSRFAAVAFAQVDGVLVARAMGGATVRAHRLALNLAAAPSQKIGALFARVPGPLSANVQTDKAQVHTSLRRTHFPMWTALFTTARAVIRVDSIWKRATISRSWRPDSTLGSASC